MDLFKVFEEAPSEAPPPAPKRSHSPPNGTASRSASVKKPKKANGASGDSAAEPVEPTEEPAELVRPPKVTDSMEVEATQNYKEEDAGVLQIRHQVRHDVALPPDYDYFPISQHKPSENPARSYPFTLDPFQQISVNAIERGESVLVSAQTSAGKTVVAEYAIAQSLRDKQRVIYTSPIKALSNQKYRELLADFGDVGLMTGDVTINPDASCLVMTTEILRSMLYRGSEVMREVAWVIFDEIHYMRDKERGVVWEETIILLPDNVRYVFLSATIPNAMEFAEWVCDTHAQPCHVVYTNYRPTPLQHYLFPEGGSGIMLVVDERGQFREENFHKAMTTISDKEGAAKDQKKKKDGPSDISRIIKMIMNKNFNPVIVFSFSKRECENLAMKLSKNNFNSAEEQDMVSKVFKNAMEQLSPADRQLQQIQAIFPLLKNGIGVHHSGLLPILKEVIELLFQEGLLKVLFATETFSIGLNMPAKTVVFTSVRKFDGKTMRWVSGGEYIQMSGRAGRRGLDDRGIVIMMINEQMEPAVAKGMVKGVADRLDSAFHLGYNMILNLLRVEGISPEYMLERCFYQFQNAQKVPQLDLERRELLEQADQIEVEDEEAVSGYWNLQKKIKEYGTDMARVVAHPSNALPFLKPGRLVHIVYETGNEKLDFGWGVIASVTNRPKPRRHTATDWTDHQRYIMSVVVEVAATTPMNLVRKLDPNLVPGVVPPPPAGKSDSKSDSKPDSKPVVLPFTLDSLSEIASIRVNVPDSLDDTKSRRAVLGIVSKAVHKFGAPGLPLLDPIEDMKIKDEHFLNLVRRAEVLEAKAAESPLVQTPERLASLYQQYGEKQALLDAAEAVQQKVHDAKSILQMDELKARKRVLRKLGFSTSGDVVELKGRVACEISSGDELLLTELIFNGTFTSLTPEQTAALLSCFVFDERVENTKKIASELMDPFRVVQTMARQIAKVSIEAKLPLVEDEYVQKFKPELMDIVYQWAKGATFADIVKQTDVFEGSLIRIFRRLEELLRQMSSAATTIGNDELAQKMDKALSLLQRDLVSAASLYL